jgi:hypothetical protein
MSSNNKKRLRTDDDIDRRSSSLQTATLLSSNLRQPEHLSAFAAIRARQSESTSDARQLPRRDGPPGQSGAEDDRAAHGEGSEEYGDATVAVARPAVRASLESWKNVLDARPDEGYFSTVDNGERVMMKKKQSLVIAGQYYLRVLSGAACIDHWSMVPGSPVEKVVAPSTEPLPVIVSWTDDTQVEISSVAEYENFETLGGVSPLFQEIWASWASMSASEPKRTYHIV